MPESMEKKSVESDHPELRSFSDLAVFAIINLKPLTLHMLDIFSAQGDLIPSAKCQTSRDTSLEYQHIIL